MKLYDIHTHNKQKRVGETDTVEILNFSIGQDHLNSMDKKQLYSCGVHPWFVDETSNRLLLELKNLVVCDNIIAIGEIGLDKLSKSSYTRQLEMFKKQVNIAAENNKPIIIHCVKAWDDLISICKINKLNIPLIVHGFRGKPELAQQLCNHNFYLSVGERYNVNGLKQIPSEKLLLETDVSGYNIEYIYKKVAKDLDIDIEKLIKIVTCNVKKVFAKQLSDSFILKK